MMSFKDVAKATLKIECGDSRGSSFHFLKQDIVVTNFYVIRLHIEQEAKIFAKTELSSQTELGIIRILS